MGGKDIDSAVAAAKWLAANPPLSSQDKTASRERQAPQKSRTEGPVYSRENRRWPSNLGVALSRESIVLMGMSSQADNYWPEPCAYCGGDGKLPVHLRGLIEGHHLSVELLSDRDTLPNCVACRGKAFVLVLQPAQTCRNCAGTGRRGLVCQYCRGTGWMFVLNESR